MSSSNRFRDFLDKSKENEEKRCWFCNRSEEDIKNQYFQYMMRPDTEFDDVPLDELLVMTYKLQKPVCAACYFNIKESVDLIEEIYNKPEEEVW